MLKSCSKLSPCFTVVFVRQQAWRASRRFVTTTAISTERIPPSMLDRARTIASEHATLKAYLGDNYDVKVAKRIGELSGTAEAFEQWDSACKSLAELQDLLRDPSSDDDLRTIAREEVDSTTKHVARLATNLRTALVPTHPFAQLPCLIELRPGAGGSEAGLFAAELFRMYQAYCRRHGLRATVLSVTASDSAGDEEIQEAIVKVEEDGSYGTLRCEAGVHRVQRVPATETKGRTHTSAVQVLVLPCFPEQSNGELDFEDPESEYYIHPSDVETETMRARGAGGQHVNTTDSAVRLRHLPSGIVVGVQESRSQQANRAKAWQILRARFAQGKREKREEEQASVRRGIAGKGKMDRGDKVRTYNWGQRRVTDHRSGITIHALDEVLEGGPPLDEVMDSVRSWIVERDLEALVAEEEQRSADS